MTGREKFGFAGPGKSSCIPPAGGALSFSAILSVVTLANANPTQTTNKNHEQKNRHPKINRALRLDAGLAGSSR